MRRCHARALGALARVATPRGVNAAGWKAATTLQTPARSNLPLPPATRSRGFAAGGVEEPPQSQQQQQPPAGDSSHPQTPPPPQVRVPPPSEAPPARAWLTSFVAIPTVGGWQANVVRLRPPLGPLSSLWWHVRCAPLVVDLIAWTVRNAFDRSFDVAEVLDGACDAFVYVHELLASGDVAPLRDLASPPVYDAFAATLQSYRDAGQRLVSVRVTELRSAALLGCSFRRGSDLGIVDDDEAAWAGLPEQPHTSHGRPVLSASEGTLYLTVRIRFDSTEVVELAQNTAAGGGRGDAPGGAAEARHVIENSRGHVWRFARCLPRALPAEELHTKWRLVGVE